MLQVAEEINEIKKRKDIVEKIVGSKKKNDSDVRTCFLAGICVFISTIWLQLI